MTRRGFLASAASCAVAAPGARIRAGCQTRAYGSPIPDRERLLSVLDDLAAAGYEGFETNHASLEHSLANPAPMRAEFEKRGITLIGLHMGAKLFDDAADGEQKEIRRVAAAVPSLGGTHLMLSGRALPKGANHALARKCAELNRAGAACRSLAVRLAVHNHAAELENNAAQLRTILRQTRPEDVSLMLDISYVHRAGISIPAFIREHGRRIAGFHLRDMSGEKEALMGAGEIDFRAMARALDETGWSGWAIFEMNQRTDISSRELVDGARKYMRTVMKI
jgi:sugar phosphate isomerase/epimerase